MKKYIFFFVLVGLFFGFLGSIMYIVVNATKGEIQSDLLRATRSTSQNLLVQDDEEKEPTWQERLALMSPKNYTPAGERFSMNFSVDASMFRPKNKYYQLSIDKNDVYSMFCLKQTLNSYQIKYALTHTSESTDIFLETDKQALVDEIIARLKHYEINAKFTEVWL